MSKSLSDLRAGLRFIWASSRRRFSLLLALGLISGVVAAVVPLLGTRLITALTPRVDVQAAKFPVFLIGAAIAVESGLSTWRRGFLDLMAFDIRLAAENLIVRRAVAVDLEAFEHPAFYDSVERATRAAMLRPVQLADSVLTTVTATAGGIGTAVAVISLEPTLFIPALLPFLPVWWLAQRRGAVRMRFIQEATPTERRASYFTSVLTDRESAKEIRLFGAASFFDRRRNDALAVRSDEVQREVAEVRRVEMLGTLLFGLANLLTWGIVGALALQGVGTSTSIIVFVYAFQRLKGYLVTLSWGVAEARESAELMTDISALERWDPAPELAAPELAPLRKLDIHCATYAYPEAEFDAVRQLSVSFTRGEFVAIVGPNGSGKSTLVKMLTGLLPQPEGTLVWNGSAVPGPALRARVSAVFQDSCHFNASLAENVSLGREGKPIAQALDEVGLTGVVERLRFAADTPLGRAFEDGTELSGGQWQRLMIARGIFDERCDAFVLDEASASLDPVAEHALVQQVKRFCRQKLVIVVSHRLSSIVEADRVLVMDGGSIIQTGQVQELLKTPGAFADMFRVQAAALGIPTSL